MTTVYVLYDISRTSKKISLVEIDRVVVGVTTDRDFAFKWKGSGDATTKGILEKEMLDKDNFCVHCSQIVPETKERK